MGNSIRKQCQMPMTSNEALLLAVSYPKKSNINLDSAKQISLNRHDILLPAAMESDKILYEIMKNPEFDNITERQNNVIICDSNMNASHDINFTDGEMLKDDRICVINFSSYKYSILNF